MVVVTAFLVAIGISGTLLPILPGIPLVWAAALIYGLVEGFGAPGVVAMVIITVIAAAAMWWAVRLPQKSAADGAIGIRGQLLALGFAIVGFFVVPIIGAAIGFVVGVYLAAAMVDRPRAWATTVSTIRALVVASAIQFGAAVGMGVVWVGWVVVA